jgi:HK97 family phage portal protein
MHGTIYGMRDLIGSILQRPVNRAPIPYASRRATFGGLMGATGTSRTQQLEAFGAVGTLWQIVTRLCETTAAATWHLYRKRPPGADPDSPRVEVTRHAAVDLWGMPNPFYTRQLFVETVQQPFELVGEGPLVVVKQGRVPLELWPVRPDRLEPVPHPTKYLAGWIYKGPDGEEVPLGTDEVIMLRRPHPTDPYRGGGPVQTLLADIDSAKYSAEWNRNFFINSAEPGGIVEVDKRLNDDEFDELRSRWQEQHRGVAQAHRVAILEQGKWVDRKFSMRDMQFRELRDVPRELIREAFGYPKPMLGSTDDVNRAVALAAKDIFADWLITPRLTRWRDALNTQLLPMFGRLGQGLEWDFDDPSPQDAESERADFDSKVKAADTFIQRGYDRVDVLKQLGLPDIAIAATPAGVPADPPDEDLPDDEARARHQGFVEAIADTPNRIVPFEEPEPDTTARLLARLRGDRARTARHHHKHGHDHHHWNAEPERDAWDDALAALLAAWAGVTAAQRDDLLRQIRDLVEAGNLASLPAVTAPTDRATGELLAAMAALAQVAADEALAEAAEEDVRLDAPAPPTARLEEIAGVTVALLAAELATSAAREALRVAIPGVSGVEEADRVEGAVREHLDSLTDARPREWLGGALTSAEAAGREAVYEEAELVAPTIAYYAEEVKDRSTCRRCAEVDGKWLGNTLEEVRKTYPTGGYVNCEGRIRCRGRIKAVYRPEQTRR